MKITQSPDGANAEKKDGAATASSEVVMAKQSTIMKIVGVQTTIDVVSAEKGMVLLLVLLKL